jgi:hypothetical protein
MPWGIALQAPSPGLHTPWLAGHVPAVVTNLPKTDCSEGRKAIITVTYRQGVIGTHSAPDGSVIEAGWAGAD